MQHMVQIGRGSWHLSSNVKVAKTKLKKKPEASTQIGAYLHGPINSYEVIMQRLSLHALYTGDVFN